MMMQNSELEKPKTFSQRLLGVFNIGGPQWGRPNPPSEGDDNKEHPDDEWEGQQGDEPSDEDERPEKGERPDRKRPSDDDMPPDLDEIWKDLSGRLGGLLGGAKGGGRNSGSGGGRGPNTPRRSGGGFKPPVSGKGAGVGLIVVAVFAALGWLSTGIFTVQEEQEAIVLTFGKYSRKVGPGLNWRFPTPIETHEIVSITKLREVEVGSSDVNAITGLNNASMLTQDRNILDVRFKVQYKIKSIEEYLFNNRDSEGAVAFAAESAVREVLGKTPREVAITLFSCVEEGLVTEKMLAESSLAKKKETTEAGKSPENTIASDVPSEGGDMADLGLQSEELTEIVGELSSMEDQDLLKELSSVVQGATGTDAAELDVEMTGSSECPVGTVEFPLNIPIRELIQRQLDNLGLGVEIVAVTQTKVDVPEKVRPAFDEARSATAEKESLINEGKVYANRHIASAAGVVARLEQDAEAYRASVVAQAEGDTQRFVQIYDQYKNAPDVTRTRMQIEVMEQIYSNVSKVLMDAQNNSLLYVPLDRLLSEGNPAAVRKEVGAIPQQNTGNVTKATVVTPAATTTTPAATETLRPSLRSGDIFGRR